MVSSMLSSPAVLGGLCGLLGAAIYLNTLDCGLCYDDLPAIIENQDLRPNQSWYNLLSNDFWGVPMVSEGSHKSYRPLCVATFRLNYLLAELEPMGYHLVNILLHGVVCYLYVHLVSLVCSEVWPALIAGLLFAVHPIHTEAVASVVGRADCLSGVFFLLTLLSYHRATKVNGLSVWLLVSLLCCVCATLSKETGLTGLALCLVYDFCVVNKVDLSSITKLPRRVSSHQVNGLVLRTTVLTAFGVVFALARFKLNNGLPSFGMHDNPNRFLPSPWRQLNWLHLCFVNAWLMLNPFSLSCDWRVGAVPVINTLIDPWNAATVLTLLVVIGLGLYSFSGLLDNGSTVLFGLSLLVFPYVPASNLFFPVGFVVAERVLYLPSMGLCLLAGHGLWKLHTSSSKYTKYLLHCTLVCLLLSYSLKTFQRNRDWVSNEQLYRSAVRVFPDNGLMLNNFGQELIKRGNMPQVIPALRRSVAVAPHIALLQYSLAKALNDVDQYAEAEYYFNHAVRMAADERSAKLAANIYGEYGAMLTRESNLHNTSALTYALRLWETAHRLQPADVNHLHNKGYALLKLGRYSEAKAVLENVLSTTPDHYGATYKLGEALLGMGSVLEAERQFRNVLKLNESDILAKFQLAALLMKSGASGEQLTEAHKLLLEVTRSEPHNENAMFALGVVCHSQHHLSLAEDAFLHTLTLSPSHTSALYNLGYMYVQSKRCREAKEMLSRLLELRPLHAQGLAQLAACYVYSGDYVTAMELYDRAILSSNGKPDANTLSNYGAVLREIGRLKDSEDMLMSALSLKDANRNVVLNELNKTRTLISSAR